MMVSLLTLRSLRILLAAAVLAFCSCSSSRIAMEERKFPVEDLRKDFTLFRNILEESHPSLYWFTPKDSMDYYFNSGYASLKDSLTERQFRTLLTYTATQIRCGHTSVRYSKKFSSYLDTAKNLMFPLSLTFYGDSAMVRGNLLRNVPLQRGTAVHFIDGKSIPEIRDSLFQFIPADGYAISGKYQGLSNSGNFGGWYRNAYGLRDSFSIVYTDSANNMVSGTFPWFDPAKDSLYIVRQRSDKKLSRRERRSQRRMIARNVQLDTALSSAYMTLRTFGRGNSLPSFFRKTFRYLDKADVRNLVVDIRGNGGGDAGNAVMLLRYLADKPFLIADSLYAIKKSSQYRKHIRMQHLYWMLMTVVTRRQADGNYHFGYFERKVFKPKRKHHFDGDIYILTGGNSFSAASIFAGKLKGQSNVLIVGEETGGGAYGNTAWMIPEVTLPNTGLRFRLPKFRLVMNAALVAGGRGVLPDLEIKTDGEMIRSGLDLRPGLVRRLIELKQNASGK